MTVSLRVTDTATGERSVRGMLHIADLALYAAKRSGRDRVMRADRRQPWDGSPSVVAASAAR